MLPFRTRGHSSRRRKRGRAQAPFRDDSKWSVSCQPSLGVSTGQVHHTPTRSGTMPLPFHEQTTHLPPFLPLHVCARTSGRPGPQSRRWWSWLEPQQPRVGSRGAPQCDPALAPEAQAVWGSLTLGGPRRALDLNGRAGAVSGGLAEAAVPQEQRSPGSWHWGSSSGLHDLGRAPSLAQ